MAPIRCMNALLLAALVSSVAPLGAEAPPDGTAVVARIGSRAVTYDELDRAALRQDAARFRGLRLRDAIYEARRAALDTIVADHLIEAEAAREGVPAATLLDRGIAETLTPVADADVAAWFTANQARLNGGTLEALAGKIRQALEETRRHEARTRFVDRLRARSRVSVLLTPPREAIAIQPQEPGAGSEQAPIQIVMYSDYQCPYCARVTPTLERVKEVYGERVRIVVRDFPLESIHPRAVDAAKAARCAHEQGRFWDYYDRLFSTQTRMGQSDFLQHAASLGLDQATFTACTASERIAALVRDDMRSGERLGVSSTPAFFVNGRFLPGAQPFEAFKRVIDAELASARAQ